MNDSRLTSPRQNQGEKGGMRQVASGEVLETCLVFLSLHPKDKSNSRNILVLGLNIHVAGSFCLLLHLKLLRDPSVTTCHLSLGNSFQVLWLGSPLIFICVNNFKHQLLQPSFQLWRLLLDCSKTCKRPPGGARDDRPSDSSFHL